MSDASHILFGRKAVRELLERDPARVHKLCVAEGSRGGSVRELIAVARAAQVRIQYVPRRMLDRESGGGVHQGVLVETQAVRTEDLGTFLAAVDIATHPILVACDGITDPHNLGAIARSAAAAGAAGLMVPTRGSAPLSGTVRKAAAGALEQVPVVKVPNLGKGLAACAAAGYWVVGTAPEGPISLYDADLTGALVLVLGNEDRGLRPGVRQQCDALMSIPLAAEVASLNVSVAAGVALFEARRQRAVAASPGR